jgi:hypothetical protein
MQSTVIAADSVFMVCKNLPFEEGNCVLPSPDNPPLVGCIAML